MSCSMRYVLPPLFCHLPAVLESRGFNSRSEIGGGLILVRVLLRRGPPGAVWYAFPDL